MVKNKERKYFKKITKGDTVLDCEVWFFLNCAVFCNNQLWGQVLTLSSNDPKEKVTNSVEEQAVCDSHEIPEEHCYGK